MTNASKDTDLGTTCFWTPSTALSPLLELWAPGRSLSIPVDPADDKARAFYEKYGFAPLPGTNRMFAKLV